MNTQQTSQIDPHEDLRQVRQLMERSTQFGYLSAKGFIWAGIVGLIGTTAMWQLANTALQAPNSDWLIEAALWLLPFILAFSLIFIVGWTSWLLAHEHGEIQTPFSSGTRALLQFLIPILNGGGLMLFLAGQGQYAWVIPAFFAIFSISLGNLMQLLPIWERKAVSWLMMLQGYLLIVTSNQVPHVLPQLQSLAIGIGIGPLFLGLYLLWYRRRKTDSAPVGPEAAS